MRRIHDRTAAITISGLLGLALSFGSTTTQAQGWKDKARDVGKDVVGSARDKVAGSTTDFLADSITSNVVESELSQLALKKAGSGVLKRFARNSLDSSQSQNQELQELAEKKGVKAPAEPSADDRSTIDRLKGLSGERFEKGYLSEMIKRKGSDLVGLRRQAAAGEDKDLKRWAKKVIPEERETLNRARELGERLGLGGDK